MATTVRTVITAIADIPVHADRKEPIMADDAGPAGPAIRFRVVQIGEKLKGNMTG
jgi:hypothetical protein